MQMFMFFFNQLSSAKHITYVKFLSDLLTFKVRFTHFILCLKKCRIEIVNVASYISGFSDLFLFRYQKIIANFFLKDETTNTNTNNLVITNGFL